MYGNTALHYAKSYPDQSIVKYLLSHGAKLDVNPQNEVNLNDRTLEEYFFEKCVIAEGDDVDDEVCSTDNLCELISVENK
jgi:ankyrin repeat protein